MSKNLSEFGKSQEPSWRKTVTGQSRANPRDEGWLAGIIDGEGCLHVTWSKQRSLTPHVTIGNTSLWLLERCNQVIEQICGQRFKVRGRKTPVDKKPVYCLELTNRCAIEAVLQAVLPSLTVKYEQAVEMLLFCETRRTRKEFHSGLSPREEEFPARLKLLRQQSHSFVPGGVEAKREAPAILGRPKKVG